MNQDLHRKTVEIRKADKNKIRNQQLSDYLHSFDTSNKRIKINIDTFYEYKQLYSETEIALDAWLVAQPNPTDEVNLRFLTNFLQLQQKCMENIYHPSTFCIFDTELVTKLIPCITKLQVEKTETDLTTLQASEALKLYYKLLDFFVVMTRAEENHLNKLLDDKDEFLVMWLSLLNSRDSFVLEKCLAGLRNIFATTRAPRRQMDSSFIEQFVRVFHPMNPQHTYDVTLNAIHFFVNYIQLPLVHLSCAPLILGYLVLFLESEYEDYHIAACMALQLYLKEGGSVWIQAIMFDNPTLLHKVIDIAESPKTMIDVWPAAMGVIACMVSCNLETTQRYLQHRRAWQVFTALLFDRHSHTLENGCAAVPLLFQNGLPIIQEAFARDIVRQIHLKFVESPSLQVKEHLALALIYAIQFGTQQQTEYMIAEYGTLTIVDRLLDFKTIEAHLTGLELLDECLTKAGSYMLERDMLTIAEKVEEIGLKKRLEDMSNLSNNERVIAYANVILDTHLNTEESDDYVYHVQQEEGCGSMEEETTRMTTSSFLQDHNFDFS
jgi:hypothetical protein